MKIKLLRYGILVGILAAAALAVFVAVSLRPAPMWELTEHRVLRYTYNPESDESAEETYFDVWVSKNATPENREMGGLEWKYGTVLVISYRGVDSPEGWKMSVLWNSPSGRRMSYFHPNEHDFVLNNFAPELRYVAEHYDEFFCAIVYPRLGMVQILARPNEDNRIVYEDALRIYQSILRGIAGPNEWEYLP